MISEHFAAIADALSPRYRLERLLQNGIAAAVFLAEDSTTGQPVAVKVLRDEMTATVNADRFMAEIRVARELRHPNIVPVLQSGEIGGLPYFVMPFIAGETLRARLARLGRLPLTDALRIAADIARALDYAHRHRVVHRDIKPENVMLDRGRAMVLDFGIALALDRSDTPRYTLPGLTLGTIHYTSPEQLDGERDVDGRADLYSLACVIYEMMSGRPPFIGKPNAVIRRHLDEVPRPLGSVCPGIPPRIGNALARALEKVPDARFSTAGALVAALQAGGPPVRAPGRCIAVVPFANVTAQPTVDPFSDGVSEEIAAALRTLGGVRIAAAVPVDGQRPDVHFGRIRRLTGADLILLGDVRLASDDFALFVAVSLFDATDGRRIWSGAPVGVRCGDRTELGRIARALARAIGDTLGLPADEAAEPLQYALPPLAGPGSRLCPIAEPGVRYEQTRAGSGRL